MNIIITIIITININTTIITIIITIIREEVEQKENIAALAVGQAKVGLIMITMMMVICPKKEIWTPEIFVILAQRDIWTNFPLGKMVGR